MRFAWLRLLSVWNSFLVWTGIRKLSFRDKLPPDARVHFDEIVKLFKQPEKGRPTHMGQIKDLCAPMMNSCRTNLWIANLGDIEPFLVADLSPPSTIRARDTELDKEVTVFGSVRMSFYDVVGGSMVARLASLMTGMSTDLSVKIVDSVGTILEVWKMKVRPIAIYPLMVLDYTRAEPIKWQLECECSEWNIQTVGDEENSGTVN